MYPTPFLTQARYLLEEAAMRGLMIATAESCTGGLIAGLLTEIPGSSVVFDRGFVTYSNEAKIDVLGVSPALIEANGAVSKETASAMAAGALKRSKAHVSIAVTGIAGPGGGTEDKPVGLVHLCVAGPDSREICREKRYTDIGRTKVRERTVEDGLDMLKAMIRTVPSRVQA